MNTPTFTFTILVCLVLVLNIDFTYAKESNTWSVFGTELNRYGITIDATSGMGERGQSRIDHQYEKLKEAYNKLTEEEKTKFGDIVPRYIQYNDGHGGFASGMGNLKY